MNLSPLFKTIAFQLITFFFLATAVFSSTVQAQTTFTNATLIDITDVNETGVGPSPAAPYPSTINVSGMSGTITKVTVKLNGFSHTRPRDLDILLVSPGGQKMTIMSDVGGLNAVTGVTLTLDDAGAALMPDDAGGALTTTTYQPTNRPGAEGSFPGPAPASPYNDAPPTGIATFASVFNGGSPNGTWSLYVLDDAGTPCPCNNSFSGGWSLIITSGSAAPTVTTVNSNNNPSFTTAPNNSVTFTATVTASGSPVTAGTVTFREGATILSGPTGLNGSGQATFTTTAFTEGNHIITATYNGTASFGTSNGSITQVVDNHTVISGNQFCNSNSAITVIDNTTGLPSTPYPSRIFVSGLSGTITNLTLTLNNFTAPRANNIDVLLVGPGGQKFIPMSDAGPVSTGPAGITLTLTDAGATVLPADPTALSSGTFKPTNYGTADGFASPAPAAPYNDPQPAGVATFASVYNGSNPNGTWSLYVADDAGGGGNSTIGSWCLTVTTSASAAPTTTVLTSGNNPSFTTAPNNAVTFTATVTSSGSPVTAGTVTFTEGATTLSGPTAVNASGQASFTTSSFTEGNHSITATYSGTLSFATSSANLVQVVDNHTVVSGNQFCNSNSAITVIDNATTIPATPYPSRIFVSGLVGNTTKVTLTLNNLTAPRANNLDILLVGPGGQTFVPLSDVGPISTGPTNITLTLDDAATNTLPVDPNPLVSGTFKPTNAGNPAVESFLSPAPAGPL